MVLGGACILMRQINKPTDMYIIMYCVKCYEKNDWKDTFYARDWGDPGSLRLIGHRMWIRSGRMPNRAESSIQM